MFLNQLATRIISLILLLRTPILTFEIWCVTGFNAKRNTETATSHCNDNSLVSFARIYLSAFPSRLHVSSTNIAKLYQENPVAYAILRFQAHSLFTDPCEEPIFLIYLISGGLNNTITTAQKQYRKIIDPIKIKSNAPVIPTINID